MVQLDMIIRFENFHQESRLGGHLLNNSGTILGLAYTIDIHVTARAVARHKIQEGEG